MTGSVSGRKFDDADGDGVFDPTEVGLAGWTIYRDVNDNGVLDTDRRQFFSGPFPQFIDDATTVPGTDFSFPGFTIATLPVSGLSGRVIDANVTITLAHPRVSDLSLTLVSPSGHFVNLVPYGGASGANFGTTTFDDSAVRPLSAGAAPYAGTFRPAEPLAGFDSDNPNGAWVMFINDNTPGATGSLNDWSLDLTVGDPRRITGLDGSYSFDGLTPGVSHVIREVAQGGWRQTAPGGDGAYRVRLDSDQDVAGRDFGNHVDLSPPRAQVTQVFVGGPGLSGGTPNANQLAFRAAAGIDGTYGYPVPDGAAQLRPLPWFSGVKTVSLRFSSDVTGWLDAGDLHARGSRVGPLALSDFTYDPATRTGTWTLPTAVTADKLRLVLGAADVPSLDGEWSNGADAYPSGDGTSGGDFNFRINVLRGDSTGDGVVNALDLADVKRRLTRRPNDGMTGAGAYSIFSDVTMDGVINALDLAAVKQRLTNRINDLPEPA
jgi:subtilisin-like proprotein convertase family protein